tara:strand:- start:3921 stop:4517 length:597 start_codon:yes stop_codon:yes gene_type:complete
MNYLTKLYRSLILDSELYQEIKTDEQLTRQALFTVLLVAIIEIFFYIEPDGGLISTILNILGRFVKWCLWAFFIAFLGTRIVPEPMTESNREEFIRTLGFAYAPGILYIFTFLPGVIGAVIIPYVVSLWQLSSMVVAAKQTLNFSSTTRAIGVCVVASILLFFIAAVSLAFSWIFGLIGEAIIYPWENPFIEPVSSET